MKLSMFFGMMGIILAGAVLPACEKDTKDDNELPPGVVVKPILMVIDEESIDNGNEPNNFSANDVNDQLAKVGFRTPLRYFRDRVGSEIELYTGQVGDEGWFAIRNIQNSWKSAGPTTNGAMNFFKAGPGLGENGSEDLLDEVPDVIPMRAAGLKMLINQTVIAVVYDSDISINYDPIEANLKGDNLGVVAFRVLSVRERTNGSSSDLPIVKIKILDVDETLEKGLYLFKNTPTILSSSEPFNVSLPDTVADPVLEEAP